MCLDCDPRVQALRAGDAAHGRVMRPGCAGRWASGGPTLAGFRRRESVGATAVVWWGLRHMV